MSFITDNSYFFNGMLTSNGRKAVASGKLNLKYYAFGDSDTNYKDSLNTQVLKPGMHEDTFRSFVSRTDCEAFESLDDINFKTIECCYANSEISKDFFETTSGFNPKKIVKQGVFDSSILNGSLEINMGADFGLIKAKDGDIIALRLIQDAALPPQVLFYQFKIKKPYNIILLERALPVYSGSASFEIEYYVLRGFIEDYYNSNFNINWDYNNCNFFKDCSIDNADVFTYSQTICGDLPGIKSCPPDDTNLPSNYAGFLNKIGYSEYCTPCSTGQTVCIDDIINERDAPYKNRIGIIHYTNPSCDDLGGDFFFIDDEINLEINLPQIIWYDNPLTASGLTLMASGSTVSDSCSFPYVPLYANSKIVGRVFTTLKVVIIDDQELLNVLSFNGNRNYALPPINGKLIGTSSPHLLQPGEMLHLTYVFENDELTHYIFPQGNIKVLENLTTKAKNVEVTFDTEDGFKWMDAGVFSAHRFFLVVQITPVGVLPTGDQWRKLDFTSLNLTGGVTGGKIVPDVLYDLVCRPSLSQYNSAPYYFVDVFNTQTDECQCLNLGQETPFIGNFAVHPGSCNYKSVFELEVDGNLYAVTQNKTHTDENISITEAGFFDDTKQLVMLFKMKHPITLTSQDKVTMELSMDF